MEGLPELFVCEVIDFGLGSIAQTDGRGQEVQSRSLGVGQDACVVGLERPRTRKLCTVFVMVIRIIIIIVRIRTLQHDAFFFSFVVYCVSFVAMFSFFFLWSIFIEVVGANFVYSLR